MLWPSLVIIVCCAVFLRLETRRRRLTFCGRRSDAASLLLLPPPDVVQESSAQIHASGDGNNHLPLAPPPTPLPFSLANSGEQLSVTSTGHRSPCRRQASLPSNFTGKHESPMLEVPQKSELTAENHRAATVKRATKSWSSSLTLRDCGIDRQTPSPCCNELENELPTTTVAIYVGSDDDSVNHDVMTA